MSYNFLKFSIKNSFGLVQDEQEILNNIDLDENNKYSVGHNFQEFKSILNFLASNDSDCLVIKGLMGSGKSTLLNTVNSVLAPMTITLKINCFNSTTLDDILISIYEQFKNYHNKRKIDLPNINTNNFKERINSYIQSINHPFVLMIDSFENVILNQDNIGEILPFIAYMAKQSKFKVIFCSRTFNSDLLEPYGLKTDWTMLSNFDKEGLAIYLEDNEIESDEQTLTKFMEITNGYFLHITTTKDLLALFRISLADFLKEYSKKNINFDEFLFSKLISLVPQNFQELLWLFTIIRSGITKSLLKQFELIEKDELEYLLKRNIIYYADGVYAIKNYIKQEINKSIPNITKIKINKYIKEFYESQLPLRPSERMLKLSRNTMRNEIEYHSQEIRMLTNDNQRGDSPKHLFIRTFSNNNWIFKKVEEKTEVPEFQEEVKGFIKSDKEELSVSQTLNQPAETKNEYIELAKQNENNFEYNRALRYYEKALSEIDKSDLDTYIITLLKLSENNEKLNNWTKAINYLEKIYQIYNDNFELLKAEKILFKISQIYKNIYDYSKAREYLYKIINSQNEKTDEFLAECKLSLAEMFASDNLDYSKTEQFFIEALLYAQKANNKNMIAEIYFKTGLFYDDNSVTDKALEQYLENIQQSQDYEENHYLSSAYSNAAVIYIDKKQISLAVNYFNKALKIDENTQNYDGLYFIFSKLAWIYFRSDKRRAFQYLLKALDAAKKIQDEFYIASIYLEIGDFYYNIKHDELALKYYIYAQKHLPAEASFDNTERITVRMRDIKQRQGEKQYNTMLDIIQNAGKLQ